MPRRGATDSGEESAAERFDLVVPDMPRHVRIAVGKKGVLDVDVDRIPAHLLAGEDGLFLKGVKELLSGTCAGSGQDISRAERTLEAWYAGYPNIRAASIAVESAFRDRERQRAEAALGRAEAEMERQVFEMVRGFAEASGLEGLEGAGRRDMRRKLGEEEYRRLEEIARSLVKRQVAKRE